MKPVSALLWELSEKDLPMLPDGFPVLRYDTLTENLSVLHVGAIRFLKDKRYVYLAYRLPRVIPENGDGQLTAARDPPGHNPRKRGDCSGEKCKKSPAKRIDLSAGDMV